MTTEKNLIPKPGNLIKWTSRTNPNNWELYFVLEVYGRSVEAFCLATGLYKVFTNSFKEPYQIQFPFDKRYWKVIK